MAIADYDKTVILLPLGEDFTSYHSLQTSGFNISPQSGLTISADQSAFTSYPGSVHFATNINGLSVSTSMTAPFCAEVWIYITSDDYSIVRRLFSKSLGFEMGIAETSGKFYAVYERYDTSVFEIVPYLIETAAPLALNAWHHIAATVDGTYFRLFVNGAMIDELAYEYDAGFGSSPLIGALFGAYANDIIITRGAAKYTASFTPPGPAYYRTVSRASNPEDFAPYERAILFDWDAGALQKEFLPDESNDLAATPLLDLSYGVIFAAEDCKPICRGPVEVDP